MTAAKKPSIVAQGDVEVYLGICSSRAIRYRAAQKPISTCRRHLGSTATRRTGQNPLFPSEETSSTQSKQNLDAILDTHRTTWDPHARPKSPVELAILKARSQHPDKRRGRLSPKSIPPSPQVLLLETDLRDVEQSLFDTWTLRPEVQTQLQQRFLTADWFIKQYTNVLNNIQACIARTKRKLHPIHFEELNEKLSGNISDVRPRLDTLRRAAVDRALFHQLWARRSTLVQQLDSIQSRRAKFQLPKYLLPHPTGDHDAAAIAMRKQHHIDNAGRHKRRKIERKAPSVLETCSSDDVLAFEVKELLQRPRQESSTDLIEAAKNHETTGQPSPDNDFCHILLDVEKLSATGEGLARHPTLDLVYVVPFTLAGERVIANVPVNRPTKAWTNGDLVQVLKSSALREGVTPQCKYFGQCSGCQLQMIPYSEQLKHKKTIVEQAYRNFSGLGSDHLPPIADTGASPLQYGYRTKLTPHFDGPRKDSLYLNAPPIGFTRKGFRHVMDIESCPIGTPIVQDGLRIERAKVAANIKQYKRGATILLRESTERIISNTDSGEETPANSPLVPQSLEALPAPNEPNAEIAASSTGPSSTSTYTINSTTITDIKTYTTDNTAQSFEQIGSYTFSTRAGSFFQNNNSILPSFLSHVRSLAQPASPNPPLKYLLDAYCGSGLFALTLSPLYTSVLGIELDMHGVTSARQNAKRNAVTNAGFIEADAAALFADVPFPADQTALVIDPPRKGCSVDFLRQLLRYGPQRVIYVSCNVNSQARDVGCLVKGVVGNDFWKVPEEDGGKKRNVEVGRWRYVVESLQGWDFFPQTGHVEGLCVLSRVENEAWTGETKGSAEQMRDEGGKTAEDGTAGVANQVGQKTPFVDLGGT